MREHVKRECTCNAVGCMFCDGGLFECTACRSFEGATTTECPGVPMNADQIDRVYEGLLDYFDGRWHERASRYSPAFYKPRAPKPEEPDAP